MKQIKTGWGQEWKTVPIVDKPKMKTGMTKFSESIPITPEVIAEIRDALETRSMRRVATYMGYAKRARDSSRLNDILYKRNNRVPIWRMDLLRKNIREEKPSKMDLIPDED